MARLYSLTKEVTYSDHRIFRDRGCPSKVQNRIRRASLCKSEEDVDEQSQANYA